jgi:quinol monooxygenase YgiN
MFGVIAVANVKESEIAQFEDVASQLARDVKANEAECATFQVFKIKGQAGGYKILEIYQSKDAFKAHVKSDHFVAAQPKMDACFETPMQVETLEGL